MKLITIKPLDILFFRNYKPFDAGEGSYGEVLPQPYPSTFYGALKTKILYEMCNDYIQFKKGKAGKLNEIIGYPNARKKDGSLKNGSLKITFFGIGKCKTNNNVEEFGKDKCLDMEILLPIPRDLVKYKDDDEGELHQLSLKKRPEYITYDDNYVLDYILCDKDSKKVESPDTKYITKNQIEDYLNCKNLKIKDNCNDNDNKNSQDKKNNKNNNNIFDVEFRTGIEIDNNLKTTKNGHLYQLECLRLKEGYSYIVGYDGDCEKLPKSGVLKLGGESKIAKYDSLNLDTNINLSDETLNNILTKKRFKIYLATPAIFNNGWRPRWIGDDLKGTIPNTHINVKLIAASVGKYITVGGWDVANNKPKSCYRAVPEGSVYYFEILNNNNDNNINNNNTNNEELRNALNVLHGKSISEIKKEEGFGITYIGGI